MREGEERKERKEGGGTGKDAEGTRERQGARLRVSGPPEVKKKGNQMSEFASVCGLILCDNRDY